MSQIHYKFKSSKDYDSITFDGHSISVFDLKRDILIAKGLRGVEDIVLTHAESGEEYYDDSALIPRNTSILVARKPTKPGRSSAQKYLEGGGPVPRGGGMTRNVFDRDTNDARDPIGAAKVFNTAMSQLDEQRSSAPAVDTSNMTEEERLKFMFQQNTQYWDKTQEVMANAPYRKLAKFQSPTRPPPAPGAASAEAGGSSSTPIISQYQKPQEQQQRPPPSNYVCFRCGNKGHWIQFCPTNNDKQFEPIGVKRTTGIPRSHLKTVEQVPTDGKKGVMVTQDGNLVVAQMNDSAWKKLQEMSRGTLAADDWYSSAPVPEELKCPIDNKLLRNAVKAPCCGSRFCDECIGNYLLHPPRHEEQFHCHHCHKSLVPDQLAPDYDMRKRVENHIRNLAKRPNEDSPDQPTNTGVPNNDVTRARSPFSESKPVHSEDQEDTEATETIPKRRASRDLADRGSSEPENGRDHWQNKRQTVSHQNNNNQNSFGYNYNNNNNNRQQYGGPMSNRSGSSINNSVNNNMGGPDFFGNMMNDPSLFMDPAFFAQNGMPFIPPGFIPPFGPQGVPEFWNGHGAGGMPNIPIGPGFPPPRIGFSDERGRGRGGWRGASSSRGRGELQDRGFAGRDTFQQSVGGGYGMGRGRGSGVGGTAFNPQQQPGGPGGNREEANAPSHSQQQAGNHRNSQSEREHSIPSTSREPLSRRDSKSDVDDFDMSKLPTGPRNTSTSLPSESNHRLNDDDDDDDIPRGPRAGVEDDTPRGPRAGVDDTSAFRKRNDSTSPAPPVGPRADRARSGTPTGPRNRSPSVSGGHSHRSRHESRDLSERHDSRHQSRDRSERHDSRNRSRDRDRQDLESSNRRHHRRESPSPRRHSSLNHRSSENNTSSTRDQPHRDRSDRDRSDRRSGGNSSRSGRDYDGDRDRDRERERENDRDRDRDRDRGGRDRDRDRGNGGHSSSRGRNVDDDSSRFNDHHRSSSQRDHQYHSSSSRSREPSVSGLDQDGQSHSRSASRSRGETSKGAAAGPGGGSKPTRTLDDFSASNLLSSGARQEQDREKARERDREKERERQRRFGTGGSNAESKSGGGSSPHQRRR